MKNSQAGSAIWILFVAIALFGGLAYVMSQGSRTSTDWVTKEATKGEAIKGQQCANDVNVASKRLTLRGCKTISSATDMSMVTEPRCALYHSQGGGITPCTSTPIPTVCTVPNPGNACPDGSIYVGLSPDGNKRMYTTATEVISATTWSNGPGGFEDLGGPMANCSGTGAGCTQGKTMSAYLAAVVSAASPYRAAQACETLTIHGKDDWYLPSSDELGRMYDNKAQINFGAIGISATYYWSSSEASHWNGRAYHLGAWPETASEGKANSYPVRCVRTDA